MIVFIGSEEKGAYIQDVAQKYGWESAFIKPELDIRNQTSDIFNLSNVKVMVYDISQYSNTAKEIAEVIARLKVANNAKPVIHAEGYNPQSRIVMELHYAGINDFIFASFLSEKKEELIQCIEGTREKLPFEELQEEEPEEEPEKGKAGTIGIVGATARMGTTTQALQFVKYLMMKGYKACYIEMNEHGWVEELIKWYGDVEVSEELGKAHYSGVDLYYRMERLTDVLNQDYDFFVYDYGVYSDRGFNKISFLEKDLKVFTVGAKPGELDKTFDLIDNNFYQGINYIFGFVPEDLEEQEAIYDLMGDRKDRTFFAEDCRDPFVYTGSGIYEQMFPVEEIVEQSAKKKRKGFFRRKNR